ncbi:MAG: hypothetical protein MUQ25_03825 [Candidatus Aminicenantes bacterium]|nr:hypothetical protein [Candidatus Aminicenantes bacterium]
MIAIGLIVFLIASGVFVFVEGRKNAKAFKKIMDDMPKLIDLGIAAVKKGRE